jgi:hypothetical protein
MSVIAVSLAACGGSSTSAGGSGSASGTVNGVSLTSVAEAVSAVYSGADCKDSSKQEGALFILLGSNGGICSSAQSTGKYTGTLLVMEIANNATATAQPIVPGTYPITIAANPTSIAIFGQETNGCETNSYLSGSGSITITSASSSGAKGTYDITFLNDTGGTAGSLSGSFDTVNCNLNQAQVCNAGSSTC